MIRSRMRIQRVLMAGSLLVGCMMTYLATPARADAISCQHPVAIGSIYGSESTATVAGTKMAACGSRTAEIRDGRKQPYFTYQIACAPDQQAAAGGLCSTTPCSSSGRYFAYRTIHYPNGISTSAGFQCVTLNQATAAPGVSLAQVFEAIRRVRLPGGTIGATPNVRGLVNLESFFWVRGAEQPPVDLQVGGSTVHAEFRVVEYRWSFGDGSTLATEGPGTEGLGSEVHVAYRDRGTFRVTVQVAWTAEAFLDGRRVGEVGDLASQAATSYPVAE